MDRFGFGENWEKYLENLTDERIQEAERSLLEWLNMESLQGKRFIDIGSGSGVFSLAARNLGAEVYSFDYDINCVNCTQSLKDKFYKEDDKWHVEQGDVLNQKYLSGLGQYDIVYSWGVLHHTGNMYQALENAGRKVADNGILFIAIYNDQGWESKMWGRIKKVYNVSPKLLRMLVVISYFGVLWTTKSVKDIIKGNPFSSWRTYKQKRGMSPFIDARDWVGGYPFEVAKPEEIFDFFHDRGFRLEKLFTQGGGMDATSLYLKRFPYVMGVYK